MSEDKYKVRLDIFEGPLDLLLYLIKKDELDIYDVSIERITNQYLEYVNTFKLLNIDLASEFVVMAANLMYIKSRTLLPKQEQPPEEDIVEDDPRWELIRQLIEYKKFKDAAGFLHTRAIEQEDYFANSPEQVEILSETQSLPIDDANIFDLIRAFQGVIERFEQSNDLGDIVDDRFTVSDKIESLLDTTHPGQRKIFTSLFDKATTKSEIIVTFLAVLELMKMNQFKIIQDDLLGKIEIERNLSSSGSLYHTES